MGARDAYPIEDDGGLLLLSAHELAGLLTPRACLDAMGQAYAALHGDPDAAPRSLELRIEAGGFHVKAGVLPGARDVLAAKLNANFPDNPRRGLPTVQGLLLLADARDGRMLALMDSGELTAWRTAAATALAARFAARPDSRVATFVGCGRQARHQLAALADLLALEQVYAVDIVRDRSVSFAAAQSAALGLDVHPTENLAEAVARSDVVVLCTTASAPVLKSGMLRPGSFVGAVGADNPRKQELDPELMRGGAVIVDDREACAHAGEVAHAIAAGVISAADVRASLAELAASAAAGRRSPDELVIYDSVGVAVQDVAVARLALQLAEALGVGTRITFG